MFLEGRIVPFDPDSTYHLWRIQEAVRGGLPPHTDRFLNAPDGARVIWPDGFDGFLAALSRVLAGRDATPFQIEALSLFALPLFGALSLLTVHSLARRAFGHAEALVATAIAAILPAHFFAGYLGVVDHHVVEVALPGLAVALILAAGEASGRPRAVRSVAAGFVLAGLVYSVPAAMLHAALVATGLIAAALLPATRRDTAASSALLGASALAFATASLLTAPEALLRGGLAYDAPSALPMVLLAAAAASLGLLAAAARRSRRSLVVLLVAKSSLAMAGVGILLPDAAGYIGGGGVRNIIVEAQPLWRDPVNALNLYTLALPLLPFALVGMAWFRRSSGAWAVCGMGLPAAVLVLLQARFGLLFVVPAVVALGATIVTIGRALSPAGRALLIAGTLAMLVLPARFLLTQVTLTTRAAAAQVEAGEWLAANLPSAGERSGAGLTPYSVLTMWGDGNDYAYHARCPVLAGGFANSDYEPGFHDTVELLYGDDQDGSRDRLLERRRVRWIVLPAQDPSVEMLNRMVLGLGPPTRLSLYTQLYDFDGSAAQGEAGRLQPALGDLRLVHESPVTVERQGRLVPAIKIYERVPAARLVGPCMGPVVRVRVRVETDQRRQFDRLAVAPCVGGRFAVRVPHPGPVELRRGPGALVATVGVTEEDIAAGRQLAVP